VLCKLRWPTGKRAELFLGCNQIAQTDHDHDTKASDLALITKTFVEATGGLKIYISSFPWPVLKTRYFESGYIAMNFTTKCVCVGRRWFTGLLVRLTKKATVGLPRPLDYSKPDFTIHVPGRMADNLLVIEVKAVYKAKAVNPSDEQIVTDLRKLTGYRKTADYFAACYLIYGCTEADAAGFVNRCCQLAENDNEVDLTLIKLFHHAKALAPATEVAWPN